MFDLYINSKNSLLGLESALRIAISNANNFNTPGYKYVFASFTTVYSEALSSGTETTNPIHFGASMTLGSTSTDFNQGNLSIGTALDTAIVGEGLYMVSASPTEYEADDRQLYTRAGRFQADSNNEFLVDAYGRKVFGYKLDSSGNRVSDDLVAIETGGSTDIGFQDGGVLVDNYALNQEDGTTTATPMYALAITTFQNKQGLVLSSGSAYKATDATGDRLEANSSGSSIGNGGNNYGEIVSESLESSNVDVAKVALDMNLINRSYAAVQAVIDDISKIINGVISKIIS